MPYTYHIPSCAGFSALKLHTTVIQLQPSSTCLWLKPHVPTH